MGIDGAPKSMLGNWHSDVPEISWIDVREDLESQTMIHELGPTRIATSSIHPVKQQRLLNLYQINQHSQVSLVLSIKLIRMTR